jgi:hypothetical protein
MHAKMQRAEGLVIRHFAFCLLHFAFCMGMLIFGHRGSPRRFAENSVESFEETLRAGADKHPLSRRRAAGA